jgi:hypothetical protein
VIAITSGVRDMQAVLNLVWDKLLPAFHREPLAADEASANALATAMKGLSVRTPDRTVTTAPVVHKMYTFPKNTQKLESITLRPAKDGVALVCRIDGTERTIECNPGTWSKGRMAWGRLPDQPAAAAGAWTADNVFTAKVCFTETPFTYTIRLTFSGNEVKCEPEANVGFGATKEAAVVGKTE